MSTLADSGFDYDVAIVGAGVAGLGAAMALRASNTTFVVLEASHRIGGRAYTEQLTPAIPFDLGAHWIHSHELNPLFAIGREMGVALERDAEDYTLAEHFQDGRWLPRAAGVEFSEFFERQFSLMRDATRDEDTLSVFDVIDNDSPWAPYFYLFFGQDYTCDVDMVSAQDAVGYTWKGDDYAVASGFGNLIAAYGAEVPVSLNSAVQEIDWAGPGVRLKTSKGDLRVARVILTVSTGVLRACQIVFAPRLPESTLAAIAGLPMGSCTRIGLTLDGAALRDLPDDFTIKLGDEEPLHFRNRPCGFDCVEITSGGRLAEWMENQGERATIDYVMERLKQVLGNATPTVSRHIVSAWDGDVWTRGSYSYALPGARQQRARLSEPIDEKIYIAGEATSLKYYSTAHGALFSGRDAAAAIARSFQ